MLTVHFIIIIGMKNDMGRACSTWGSKKFLKRHSVLWTYIYDLYYDAVSFSVYVA